MKLIQLLAVAGVLGTAVVPATIVSTMTIAVAQNAQPPTKQQLETAVRAANPTIGQLRALKGVKQNLNNMTPQQVKEALANIFSPGQIVIIRQSLQQQGVALPH